jgi:glycosyltransferase involved in cell wall biosynthesis
MKLSVVMITYNQARFIDQAIASAVSQRVNFDYEIIVSDDHSSDGTPEVIRDYHRRYPAKIIPLLRNSNVGMMINFKESLAACSGQYVALLEGDDYWTSEDKLQKQVNFLDEHPDYAVCCHRAQLVYETGEHPPGVMPTLAAGSYTIDDLFAVNWIATGSVMYRWGSLSLLPDWFLPLKMADWPLHILIGTAGRIHLMDDLMSVYRIHGGGVWSSMARAQQLRETARMLATIRSHIGSHYLKSIQRVLMQIFFELATLARADKNRTEARRYIIDCLACGGWWFPGHRRTIASLIIYSLLG